MSNPPVPPVAAPTTPPIPTAPPVPAPVVPSPEITKVEADNAAKGLYESVGAFRRAQVVKVTFGDGDDKVDFFIREFPPRDIFQVTKQVQEVVRKFNESGLTKVEDDEEVTEVSDTALSVERLLRVIGGIEEDVYAIISKGVFKTRDGDECVTEEDIQTVGELAILLRGIYEVNWERGSTKNALAGLGIGLGK